MTVLAPSAAGAARAPPAPGGLRPASGRLAGWRRARAAAGGAARARGGGRGAGGAWRQLVACAASAAAAPAVPRDFRRRLRRRPDFLEVENSEEDRPPAAGPWARRPALTPELATELLFRSTEESGRLDVPVTAWTVAKRLVVSTLGRLLDARPYERTRERCDEEAEKALSANKRIVEPFPEARSMLGRSLEQYFRMEDPREASAACVECEVTTPIRGGDDGEPGIMLLPCVDRADGEVVGGKRALTLVDYGVNPRETQNKLAFRMMVQAWALRESGVFACDVLHMRRLELYSGGRELRKTLSAEELAGVSERVARAWQAYLQAFPAEGASTR